MPPFQHAKPQRAPRRLLHFPSTLVAPAAASAQICVATVVTLAAQIVVAWRLARRQASQVSPLLAMFEQQWMVGPWCQRHRGVQFGIMPLWLPRHVSARIPACQASSPLGVTRARSFFSCHSHSADFRHSPVKIVLDA